MKKRHVSGRTLKQLFLAVPAAALMLGSSQAQTTVGLNFQGYYYGGGTTNAAVVGYGLGYQTTGFPVTATAFGVDVTNWTSTEPLGDVPISTNFTFAGTLAAEVTAPDAWESGIGELVAGWNPEHIPPGNDEVTWAYLDDGNALSNSPSVSVSGLAAKFPHGYVVQTIAAEGNVATFDGVDFTDGITNDLVAYSTYYIANPVNDGYDLGGTVGLSAQSIVFTNDTINIDCVPKTAANRSTLAGFIITDEPVVTYSAPADTLVVPGGSFVLSASAIGIGNLSYQWQKGGTNIPGATFANYTNNSAALTDGGNYQVVATSDSFPANPGVGAIQVVTVHAPQTNTWDANTNASGTHPLDGSGTWSLAGTNWWTGLLDTNLYANDTAVFGVGGTGPYTVTLADNVTVSAVTFNSGDYMITNSSGGMLTLQGAAEITANADATITAPLSTEANTFVTAGAGTLISSGDLTCGQTFVTAGTLEVLVKSADSPYIVTNGATLELGYTTGGGYANTGMEIYGDGVSATTGLYLGGGTTYNVSGTLTLLGAPTTIRQFGSGLAAIGIFDINSTGLLCSSAASGSIIDSNVQMVTFGYGMSTLVDPGANTATGDLIINGPLNISLSGGGPYGFVKRGNGSVLLNAVATETNCGLEILDGSVICGLDGCIGTNASLEIDAGATLYFNGTSQTVANVLNYAAAPAMAGTLSMSINKGGTPSSTVLTESDGGVMTLGGHLTVTNVGGILALGDTFALLNSSGGFSGKFASLALPPLADGLGWSNNFAVSGATIGTIQVVTGGGPNIDTDLSGITNYVYVGGNSTYAIVADGDPTLEYQWYQNGTIPVGSNSPTLNLTSVTLADAGYYSVIITNAYGVAHSASNYLDVVPTSGYDALIAASGPVSFWPLNEASGTTAIDYWSGYDATYTGGYTLADASNPVTGTESVQFDGATGYALTPYYPALNPALFSAEAWVNPDAAPTTEFCVMCCGQFSSSGRSGWLIYQFPTYWNLRTYYDNTTATAVNLPGISVPVVGSWTHLAVTWDGTTARLYVNGTLEGSQVPTTTPNYVPGASGGFCVGARADAAFYWGGNISDAVLYNQVLTAEEISAHAHNQPLLSIAPAGTNVVLTWTSGTGAVQSSPTLTGTYTNVPGATSSPWTNSVSGQTLFFRLKF
jgi:hypothetical protein